MQKPSRAAQILREVDPQITSLSRRHAQRCSELSEDLAQHLRERVLLDVERFAAASPALRYVMLRSLAASFARSDRRRIKRLAGLPEDLNAQQASAAEDTRLDSCDTLDVLSQRIAELDPTGLRVLNDQLMAKRSRQTADDLGITEETVRYHRARVLRALGDGLDPESMFDLQSLIEAISRATEVP